MQLKDFLASRRFVADLRPLSDIVRDEPEPVAGYVYADSYVIPQRADGRFHLFLQYDDLRADLLSCELELFYYYGRHVAPETELDLFQRLELACMQSDLDAAARYIQDGIGQEDGGTASLFFSGPDGDNWPTMGATERYPVALRYL